MKLADHHQVITHDHRIEVQETKMKEKEQGKKESQTPMMSSMP